MAALSPKLRSRLPLLGQAMLAGATLGVLGFAAGGLFLYDAEGLLAASSGFVVTLTVALAAGVWAGVPSAEGEQEPPWRARWVGAAVAVGVAGAFATLWAVYEGVRSGPLGRVLALLLLVAAPVYMLGLLIPSLFAWAEQWEAAHEDEWEAGHGEDDPAPGPWEPIGTLVLGILAGIALGALVGGLFLVPQLGSGPVLLGAAAALIVPTLFHEAEVERTTERLLYETESPLSTIRVVEVTYPARRQPERRLYQNDEEESAELVRSGAPALAYIAAAEQWLDHVSARGDSYLFLGGGAYTLPRRVAERDPSAQITVVELDPEVTRVAHRFFGLRPEHRVASVHGDARAFIEAAAAGAVAGANRFNRIFLDVYNGQEALPYSLVTREAFELTRRLLHPGGCVALNAIGVVGGAEDRRFWSIVRTLYDVFPSVALYTHLGRDYPDRQNVILGAAATADAEFPERAGLFEQWPRHEWPQTRGTVIFRDLFQPSVAKETPPREHRGGRAASTS
jgi:spermidine synthase